MIIQLFQLPIYFNIMWTNKDTSNSLLIENFRKYLRQLLQYSFAHFLYLELLSVGGKL